jgi:hypothetical protein
MAWVSITEAMVAERLAGPELAAYKSAALGTGQTNPLPNIITRAVDEVRGYIAACRANTLGEAGTIPEKLLDAALAVIRYRLISRLPVTLTQSRIDEKDDALRLLKEVAACRFAVEEPTTASTEALSGKSPRWTERTDREFTRTSQDGI